MFSGAGRGAVHIRWMVVSRGRVGRRDVGREGGGRGAVPSVPRCTGGWLEGTSCAAIYKSGSLIPLFFHLHPFHLIDLLHTFSTTYTTFSTSYTTFSTTSTSFFRGLEGLQPWSLGLADMVVDSWIFCLEEFTIYTRPHYTTGGQTCTCTSK